MDIRSINLASPVVTNQTHRVGTLVAVVALQVMVLTFFMHRDPMTWRQLTESLVGSSAARSRAAEKPDDFRGDPVIGADLSALSSKGNELEKLARPSKVGYLVISVGECAACLGMDLKTVQHQAAAEGLSTVLLTTSSAGAAKRFLQEDGLHMPICSDTDEKLSQGLNVLWPGRSFLFSSHWQLIWLQHRHHPGYSPALDSSFNRVLRGISR